VLISRVAPQFVANDPLTGLIELPTFAAPAPNTQWKIITAGGNETTGGAGFTFKLFLAPPGAEPNEIVLGESTVAIESFTTCPTYVPLWPGTTDPAVTVSPSASWTIRLETSASATQIAWSVSLALLEVS